MMSVSKFDYQAYGSDEMVDEILTTLVKHVVKNPQKTEMYVEVVTKMLHNSWNEE